MGGATKDKISGRNQPRLNTTKPIDQTSHKMKNGCMENKNRQITKEKRSRS